MNERTREQTNEWINEQTNKQTNKVMKSLQGIHDLITDNGISVYHRKLKYQYLPKLEAISSPISPTIPPIIQIVSSKLTAQCAKIGTGGSATPISVTQPSAFVSSLHLSLIAVVIVSVVLLE